MMNRQERKMDHSGAIGDRWVKLGPDLAAIPERLLLAHARGEVLFIVGAGVSRAAGLPDFRGLVLKVYEQLDKSVYELLSGLPATACKHCYINFGDLQYDKRAEVRRFVTAPKCYSVRPDPSHL
jgi:NAD-dependent SIR2 family protein deacetylase